MSINRIVLFVSLGFSVVLLRVDLGFAIECSRVFRKFLPRRGLQYGGEIVAAEYRKADFTLSEVPVKHCSFRAMAVRTCGVLLGSLQN